MDAASCDLSSKNGANQSRSATNSLGYQQNLSDADGGIPRGDRSLRLAHHAAMPSRIIYLHSQKLPARTVEAILLGYAHNLPADAIVRILNSKGIKVTAKSGSQIVKLMRNRLYEVEYFPSAAEEMDYRESGEDPNYRWSPTTQVFVSLTELPHARTKLYDPPMLSELLFRSRYKHKTAEDIYHDMKLVVRVTGPLNRPPVNLEIWQVHLCIIRMEDLIRLVRRSAAYNRAGDRQAAVLTAQTVAFAERQIALYQRELRARLRQRRIPVRPRIHGHPVSA